MPAADLIALDIGGANLKAADGRGWAHAEAFPLWREWRRLPEALARILGTGAAGHRVVATMTGEIADCYASRAEGVAHIVASLVAAAGGADVGISLVNGSIVPPEEAVRRPLEAAAANWHALARLAVAHAPTPTALLVDIGSTTTDVVPLRDGRPVPLAHDDAGRMLAGELVYSGVERTPLPAIVRSLPHRGCRRPAATERFADSRDCWLLLGELAENAAELDTADGGPATREAARVRLARTVLVEPADFSMADAIAAAEWVAEAQVRRVARAVRAVAARQIRPPGSIVFSGHGEPLARRAVDRVWPGIITMSLGAVLGPTVSRSACAHALALIARGEIA
jgi:probable H4MPT-linked C1 transfer pathway protein